MKRKIKFCFFLIITVEWCLSSSGITQAELHRIGQKIWHNECNQSIEKLTWWNEHEDFASLGIGHFIWYPEGTKKSFTQTFPDLVQFLQSKKIMVPAWMLGSCPWQSKKSFFDNFNSEKMKELRQLLRTTIPEQSSFLVHQLESIKNQLINKAEITKKDHIVACFNSLMTFPQGIFALIDYLNFKGSGLNPHESYKSQGWGLFQVLNAMAYLEDQQLLLESFISTGKKLLQARVKNAPANKPEQQWLPGWINRLESYKV